MTNTVGQFVFMLHSHLPYYRMAGMWPFGEECLYECALKIWQNVDSFDETKSTFIVTKSGKIGLDNFLFPNKVSSKFSLRRLMSFFDVT